MRLYPCSHIAATVSHDYTIHISTILLYRRYTYCCCICRCVPTLLAKMTPAELTQACSDALLTCTPVYNEDQTHDANKLPVDIASLIHSKVPASMAKDAVCNAITQYLRNNSDDLTITQIDILGRGMEAMKCVSTLNVVQECAVSMNNLMQKHSRACSGECTDICATRRNSRCAIGLTDYELLSRLDCLSLVNVLAAVSKFAATNIRSMQSKCISPGATVSCSGELSPVVLSDDANAVSLLEVINNSVRVWCASRSRGDASVRALRESTNRIRPSLAPAAAFAELTVCEFHVDNDLNMLNFFSRTTARMGASYPLIKSEFTLAIRRRTI